jgi:GNAT superfamily N-acetyltransferase
MTVASEIVVRKLSAETLDDFLAFFDGPGFADNEHWAGCVDEFYHTPGDEWDASRAAHDVHRAAKIAGVRAGKRPGFLAYRDGEVVGWLNAARFIAYENPRGFEQAYPGDRGDTGAFMCFVVHPEHRGEGIATALLEAACADFKRQGLRSAVGFARAGAPTQSWHTFATFNYHGPLSMYEKAGFEKVREERGWAVMRKEL